MTLDSECIFCKIIRKEIPCLGLHEDDRTLAFLDINPVAPGHALVVPKFHSEDLFATPEEWLSATVLAARKVAAAVHETLRPHGLNLVQANGPGAAQSVLHFHLHVIPRSADDGLTMNWPLNAGDMDDMAALAQRIRANL